MALTQSQIEKKLSNEHLDELLELWQTEQAAAKRRNLELMAAALPFPVDARLRVLDAATQIANVELVIRVHLIDTSSAYISVNSFESWRRLSCIWVVAELCL